MYVHLCVGIIFRCSEVFGLDSVRADGLGPDNLVLR